MNSQSTRVRERNHWYRLEKSANAAAQHCTVQLLLVTHWPLAEIFHTAAAAAPAWLLLVTHWPYND
jgi:hypothetical protein